MLNGLSNVFSEEVASIRQYVGQTRMKHMPCEVMGENREFWRLGRPWGQTGPGRAIRRPGVAGAIMIHHLLNRQRLWSLTV